MKHRTKRVVVKAAFAALITIGAGTLLAQTKDATIAEIERYREMLADGNPAELYEVRGEELWKAKVGPKKLSLAESCDLGIGTGVTLNAYTRMPRWFEDAKRVMDLESRVAWCRMNFQGVAEADIKKRPFGNEENKSDMEALVAFLVGQSRGQTMNVVAGHPKEVEAYEVGKRMFYYRAGPYDFACATCHSADDKRIRLQDLPNLTKPAGAQLAYGSWPAYRVSQGELSTMQWRINDCYRQQRFPEPGYLSDAVTALNMFLAVSANGGRYVGPGIKR